MSKGSRRRPATITAQEEADRWAQTFPSKPVAHHDPLRSLTAMALPPFLHGGSLAEVVGFWRRHARQLLADARGRSVPSDSDAILTRVQAIVDVLYTLSCASDASVLVNPTPKEPRNAQ